MRRLRAILLAWMLSMMAGCALFGEVPATQVPVNPELEQSRRFIKQAEQDATIQAHFRGELERARASLDQALMLWEQERGRLDEDDEEWHEIRHLNYMARQRTALIVMQARGLDAQYALNELQSERERLLLSQSHRQAALQPVTTHAPSLQVPEALQGLRPRQEPRGLVLTLDDRYFAEGDAQLSGHDALFDALLQFLVANPGKIVSCEGHTVGVLAQDNGQRLSQQRARAVQNALLERGLELSRVTAVGYGNTRQLQSGSGEGGASTRVEIVLSEAAPVNFDAKPAD